MSVKVPVDEAVDRLQGDTDMEYKYNMSRRLCPVGPRTESDVLDEAVHERTITLLYLDYRSV